MPTNQNVYNTRLTDEALEKRFRDTFRSQGGAELVDDLYASGVIIPVVDFTQAAEGSQLPNNLQTAWDFSTGSDSLINETTALISNSGFWQVDLTLTIDVVTLGSPETWRLQLNDGSSVKTIWGLTTLDKSGDVFTVTTDGHFTVFLRPGDTLQGVAPSTNGRLDVWYRQIADVSGNLINPTGFSSS